jgi:hypothetical protein
MDNSEYCETKVAQDLGLAPDWKEKLAKLLEGSEPTRFMEMHQCQKDIFEKIPNHKEFLDREIESVAKNYYERLEKTANIIKDSFGQGYYMKNEKTLVDAWENSEAKAAYDSIFVKIEEKKNSTNQ